MREVMSVGTSVWHRNPTSTSPREGTIEMVIPNASGGVYIYGVRLEDGGYRISYPEHLERREGGLS